MKFDPKDPISVAKFVTILFIGSALIKVFLF